MKRKNISKTSVLKKLMTLLFFIFLFSISKSKAVTCTALANGDWASPTNWSCGSVPTCGDLIIIPAGITVTVTSQQNYGCGIAMVLNISGTLIFTNGNKLSMPCNSQIYINAGASVVPGSGGGNSNYIEICDVNLWNAAAGTLTGPGCLPTNLPGCNTTLPVELLNFTGNLKDHLIELYWESAIENNSSHFDIERSADAIDFTKITTVASKAPNGNSLSKLSYSSIDAAPIENTSYYRLKQFDRSGGFKFSNVISVNYLKAKNIRFAIFPNPNNGEFTADISGIENNHQVTLTLKNGKGKSVYDTSFYIHEENSTKFQIIPEQKLSSGIYVCTLTIEEISYSIKVIVN